MLNKSQVENLVEKSLEERPDLFLVDVSISSGNDIVVLIDGDNGISLKDITKISRNIEEGLDRETEDFALEVGTPGVDFPLTSARQFKKNMGRLVHLRVEEDSEVYKGRISDVSDDKVTLSWKQREKKEVGKGKVTVEKNKDFDISKIVNAKVQVEF